MKTMTLFGLLDQYSVLIPHLQRNYVHGRDDAHAKEVREHFVKSLDECCTKSAEMNLDVVYGVCDDTRNVLVPIDGQQRLTTLWLSAVYVTSISTDNASRLGLLSKLSHFSYESRPLAATFCRWLTSGADVNYDTALLQAEDCWGEDPTVHSMITTLRLIHDNFNRKADDLLKVLRGENIHFEFSKVHGKDSDLYVKINARGKLLTQWENFKGEFAKQLSGDTKDEFEKQVETLSDQFFQVSNQVFPVGGIIPDNAFFALFARLTDYELRNAPNLSYDEESHSNLTVLAESKVDSKDKQDLPYVPVREFDLASSLANKLVQPFLRMVEWTLENYAAFFKYWDAANNVFQAVFFPNSADERDFSLFLYEYFRRYKSGAVLIEDDCRALRLVANIFENVARNTRNTKDNTPYTQFNRIKVLKSFLCASSALYSPTVSLGNDPQLQSVEETAKASIYQAADPVMVSMLQTCEGFLHGRVRIAILDQAKQKPIERIIDVRSHSELLLKRMKTIKHRFDTWKRFNVNERAEYFFTSIIPVFDWDIPNDVQFDYSDNGLKKLICTENDACLQRTFIDGESSQAVKAKSSYDIPAGRDWRDSIKTLKSIILQDTINASTKKDPKPWKVKWHWASERYYLYTGGSPVTWAFPISDYRIDSFTDIKFANAVKSLMKDIPESPKDLMRINDASSVHKRMNNGLDCYFLATNIMVKAIKDSVVLKEAVWNYGEFGDDISRFLHNLNELSFDKFCEHGKDAMPPSQSASPTEPSTNV